jgi:molecular chaperone GrpE
VAKANGKSEVNSGELDLEHELTAGDGAESSSGATVPRENPLATGAASGLESELRKVQAERDSLVDRLARAQAEFENARRRASKEQQDFRDYATADAIKALLPALDSFERALHTRSESRADDGDFRCGVELIYKQLQDALAKLGVRPIPAKGEAFDPHYHEAVELVETTDVPDHEILEELQRGYKFKDRLLRPAMVKVAKNPG